MSSAQGPVDEELQATETAGYKVGESKTIAELAALDQGDESLQRWKQSLGLGAGGEAAGPMKVVPLTLFLTSPTLAKDIVINLSGGDLEKLKKECLTIKEGIEYSVGITFKVENQIASGLKYLQVVKRAGLNVDRTEAMLGSYGPSPDAYTKIFASEESPSGLLARSGTYNVLSRVTDDDKKIWLDFQWTFKLAKEW